MKTRLKTGARVVHVVLSGQRYLTAKDSASFFFGFTLPKRGPISALVFDQKGARMRSHLFTSESVALGHPDKLADTISDSVLDAILKKDSRGRVACETFLTNGLVVVGGEITTEAYVDIAAIARHAILNAGYNDGKIGLDGESVGVTVSISQQSPEIAAGVFGALEHRGEAGDEISKLGAGDQGIVFGYANSDNSDYFPVAGKLAHMLTARLAELRHQPYGGSILLPDAKAQVTIRYEDGEPVAVDNVLISTQHTRSASLESLQAFVKYSVIIPVLERYTEELNLRTPLVDEGNYLINPAGTWHVGGPKADAGLTGRKIIVDSYCGYARHGGGAYCMDGDTEYLSAPGVWKKLRDYSGGKVGQWNGGLLEFVEPLEYVARPADKMYHITSSRSINMLLSENHELVYRTSKKNLAKKKMGEVAAAHASTALGWGGEVPVYFTYEDDGAGLALTDDEIRLQIAFAADGTITKQGKGRVQIKKDRKKQRLIELLERTATEYTVGQNSVDDGYRRYFFMPPVLNKSLSQVLQNASASQLAVVAEEVTLWDGKEKVCFRTTLKEDADFIQYAFMAVHGTESAISVDDRSGQEYSGGYIRKSVGYTVLRNKNRYVSFKSSQKRKRVSIELAEDIDMMYCFTVPSGMLLVRRNNKVFVTGNSGKDPSKTDRSGAYALRHVAKNLVAAGAAEELEIQVAYAIGVAEPVSISVDTKGRRSAGAVKLEGIIREVFDLRPGAILRDLQLRENPVYAETATNGHFGRNPQDRFAWERLDKVEQIQSLL